MARTATANDVLALAVRELSVEGMRVAVAAGASAVHIVTKHIDPWTAPEVSTMADLAVRAGLELAEGERETRQLAALRLLQLHGGFEDTRGSHALMLAAAWRCTPAVIELFLNAGVQQRPSGMNTSTPLHNAQSADVAGMLIAAGADLCVRDWMGETPLLGVACSCIMQPIPVTRVLLDAGADVHAVNKFKQTWLSVAAQFDCLYNRPPLLPFVLDFGIDLAATDDFGRTALASVLHDIREWGRNPHRPPAVDRMQRTRITAQLLVRAECWHRRRHLLQAVSRRATSNVVASADGAAPTVCDGGGGAVAGGSTTAQPAVHAGGAS